MNTEKDPRKTLDQPDAKASGHGFPGRELVRKVRELEKEYPVPFTLTLLVLGVAALGLGGALGDLSLPWAG